jgi:hypothetical protein
MPLTEKGKSILGSMEKTYRDPEKAKQVLYASKAAGKVTGIDSEDTMNADQTKPEDCEDASTMGVGDQPSDIGADPGVPPPEFNHPQQFPGTSAPPEKATGDVGFGARDAGPGYGGIVGGAIEQNWGDQMPGGMSLDQIQAENQRYWDQWAPLPVTGAVRTT